MSKQYNHFFHKSDSFLHPIKITEKMSFSNEGWTIKSSNYSFAIHQLRDTDSKVSYQDKEIGWIEFNYKESFAYREFKLIRALNFQMYEQNSILELGKEEPNECVWIAMKGNKIFDTFFYTKKELIKELDTRFPIYYGKLGTWKQGEQFNMSSDVDEEFILKPHLDKIKLVTCGYEEFQFTREQAEELAQYLMYFANWGDLPNKPIKTNNE